MFGFWIWDLEFGVCGWDFDFVVLVMGFKVWNFGFGIL